MNYQEAKAWRAANPDAQIYMARVDGSVWSAGRMVEVGEVIGYFSDRAAAKNACRDYERHDFDAEHLSTSVELCGSEEFEA